MDNLNLLDEITTVEEIAKHWQLHPVTVRRAIDARRNPLEARKSGKVWVISKRSAFRRWGLPKIPFEHLS